MNKNHDFHVYNQDINMSEKEYMKKYGHLYEPKELISEKLKKYNLNEAQNHLRDKLAPYHYFVAKARKTFNNSITVYKLTNEILDKIKNTSIEKMPDETPKLYSKPFIIEPHDSNSTLFGDINSIIGFYNDYEGLTPAETSMQMFNFLFHTTPKTNPQWYDSVLWLNKYILENKDRKGNMYLYLAANLFYLRPFVNKGYWDFEFIDYNKNVFNEKKFCDNCIYRNSCGGIERQIPNLKYHLCVVSLYDNILSFITIFNYMLEAENSPIQAKQQVEHTTYMANKKGKVIEKHQDWIIKYIYLDKSKIKYEDKPEYSEFDKDSLVPKTVNVKGHLRHQACGTGHKDHKWIYIESYVSKKWVKDGDTKIVVGLQK